MKNTYRQWATIADIFKLSAPPLALKELGLDTQTKSGWAKEQVEIGEAHPEHVVSLMALALYYGNRTDSTFLRTAGLQALLKPAPQVFRTLIQLCIAEESAYTEQLVEKKEADKRSRNSRNAVIKRHMSSVEHQMKEEIRKIWASGKYPNRDACAEQECGGLGISISTARKALRNTPQPVRTTNNS